MIYKLKIKYACSIADRIIVTSKSTKKDLLSQLIVDPAKIYVVYQSCQDRFFETVPSQTKKSILKKYGLSAPFVLTVSSFEERKNLSTLIKSIAILGGALSLVIVGQGNPINKKKMYHLKLKHHYF